MPFYGDQLVVVGSIGLAMGEDGLVCGAVGDVRQRGVGLRSSQAESQGGSYLVRREGPGGHALLAWLMEGWGVGMACGGVGCVAGLALSSSGSQASRSCFRSGCLSGGCG